MDDEPPSRNMNKIYKGNFKSIYAIKSTQLKELIQSIDFSELGFAILQKLENSLIDRKLTRQFKLQQLKWQEQINIPKNTEFCHLIYSCGCHKVNQRTSDANCLKPKGYGCIPYLEQAYLEPAKEPSQQNQEIEVF